MIQGKTYTIHPGSNLDILPTLPDNSVDSIVTDPPYELGFMGKKWDSSGIAYSVELWRECLRVLKPGGHLLAFGGSRTWHRIAVAIEDSGFEVRDSIAWLYGSGFPKSLDISKAIDKAAGAEREVSPQGSTNCPDFPNECSGHPNANNSLGGGVMRHALPSLAATPEAQQWEGWGTALKPAFEPVIVARKPLIGTVAENVLTYGTGGLNIDGSRIQSTGEHKKPFQPTNKERLIYGEQSGFQPTNAEGRWPANIILDEYTAELLDEQSGVSISPSKSYAGGAFGSDTTYAQDETTKGMTRTARPAHGDTGGASRFFYVAKASKRDRNEGLDTLPIRRPDERTEKGMGSFEEKGVQPQQNFHPTVKPTTLMEYLIKLVTPPNGVVLDPFTGSGSTGKAAILSGFRFIGIELTEEYLPIIQGRLEWAEAEYEQQLLKRDEALF